MSSSLNRRQFLAATGACAAGAMLHGKHVHAAAEPQAAKEGPSSPVSIQRCESYEPRVVRAKLNAALDQVGGIGQLVKDKTVTIKINVTGGPNDKLAGLPGFRTYHIHPYVLAALCGAIHDGGAKRIVVVESQYSFEVPEKLYKSAGWDVDAVIAAGGGTVSFEDTHTRGAFKDYSTLKVPWDGFLFPAFMVNRRYEETDVFISLSKLKDHLSTGVSLSIKNLFGITPTSLYGADAPNEKSLSYRGPVLHNGAVKVPAGVPAEIPGKLTAETNNWKHRVARITADCLGARPIDLAVIDGIETNRGGEGPWCKGVEAIAPKLLMVGRNALCTDAVCTAVMGYDPMADHFQWPFPCENHLKLLASVGVGQIDPKKIEVRGLSIKEALFPFNPKHLPLDYPTAYHAVKTPWALA